MTYLQERLCHNFILVSVLCFFKVFGSLWVLGKYGVLHKKISRITQIWLHLQKKKMNEMSRQTWAQKAKLF